MIAPKKKYKRKRYCDRVKPEYLRGMPQISKRSKDEMDGNWRGPIDGERIEAEIQAAAAAIKERKLRMEGILQ